MTSTVAKLGDPSAALAAAVGLAPRLGKGAPAHDQAVVRW
jgi:hypothetical protein